MKFKVHYSTVKYYKKIYFFSYEGFGPDNKLRVVLKQMIAVFVQLSQSFTEKAAYCYDYGMLKFWKNEVPWQIEFLLQ